MNPSTPTTRHNRAERGRGHLLVLACDAAIRYLTAAESGRSRGNSRAAAAEIQKAQRILLELMGALDPAIAPEATHALGGLYQRLFDCLCDPAAVTDPKIVQDARRALVYVRNAWADNPCTARASAA
jgi:flagellin-specific chaperone FliS